MRYIFVDRIVALAPGRRLRALKQVTATDGAVASYGDGMPALPGALLLEAMAQAAGLLAIASAPDAVQPVLAKVQGFAAAGQARAGDSVELDATLDDLRAEGCRATVRAAVGDRSLASATILLGLVPVDDAAERGLLQRRLEALFPGWFAGVHSVETVS